MTFLSSRNVSNRMENDLRRFLDIFCLTILAINRPTLSMGREGDRTDIRPTERCGAHFSARGIESLPLM